MNTIEKPVNKIWIMYIEVLFVIFMTDVSYISINESSIIVDVTKFAIIFVSLYFVILECIFKRMPIRIMLLLLSFSVFCTIFFTGVLFKLSFYVFVAELWFCYLFSRKYTIKDFTHCYLILMRIIAVGSLICWLFPQFFVSINIFPKFTSSVGAEYRFLGVATIPLKTHMQKRNFGPFWEPGTYQVYLNMAIFLLLFVEERKKKAFDIVLFIITDLTTMSGASLLTLGLIISAYLLKDRKIKTFITVLSSSVIITVLMNTVLFNGILLKMLGQDRNSSLMFRWIGLEGSIRAFLLHPLFGAPYTEILQIKNELALKYLGIFYGSNTSTFTNYYAYYGFFVGSFFLVASYMFFKKICKKGIVGMIAFAAYFFSTSNENLIGSLLIITVASLGFWGNLKLSIPEVIVNE